MTTDGYLLLPAFAEPHAHLDKAFLAERVDNPTGDLLGAILAMERARDSITLADTIERAETLAKRNARLIVVDKESAYLRTKLEERSTEAMYRVLQHVLRLPVEFV